MVKHWDSFLSHCNMCDLIDSIIEDGGLVSWWYWVQTIGSMLIGWRYSHKESHHLRPQLYRVYDRSLVEMTVITISGTTHILLTGSSCLVWLGSGGTNQCFQQGRWVDATSCLLMCNDYHLRRPGDPIQSLIPDLDGWADGALDPLWTDGPCRPTVA
jgi:hypothetical protein